MDKLTVALVVAGLMAGCASTNVPEGGTVRAAEEMPEYATGSNIAKKKSDKKKGELTALDPEKLDEIQRNSSIPMR